MDRGGADLAGALFEVRSAVLLGLRGEGAGAAFASGLLIGADVAAADVGGETVHLLSEGVLATLYAAAIARRGGAVRHVDSHHAFTTGIHRLRELSQ